jgi:hypothetical protein
MTGSRHRIGGTLQRAKHPPAFPECLAERLAEERPMLPSRALAAGNFERNKWMAIYETLH